MEADLWKNQTQRVELVDIMVKGYNTKVITLVDKQKLGTTKVTSSSRCFFWSFTWLTLQVCWSSYTDKQTIQTEKTEYFVWELKYEVMLWNTNFPGSKIKFSSL